MSRAARAHESMRLVGRCANCSDYLRALVGGLAAEAFFGPASVPGTRLAMPLPGRDHPGESLHLLPLADDIYIEEIAAPGSTTHLAWASR